MSEPRRIETARSVSFSNGEATIIHTDGTREVIPAGEELEFGTVTGDLNFD